MSHYTENFFQFGFVRLKEIIYGHQPYTEARLKCYPFDKDKWIHPTTLSLAVYGGVQDIFGKNGIDQLFEVLPNYRASKSSDQEIVCVADILLERSKTKKVKDLETRFFEFTTYESAYNIDPPWVSGLTQSIAGQVFIAAYLITADPVYKNAAIQVANFLLVEVDSGGVLVKLKNDKLWWYEEYAKKGRNPPFVLNGHILTLDYLYYINYIVDDEIYKIAFRRGVDALVDKIFQFQSRFGSYYDLEGNLANVKYHKFHVRQLKRYSIFDTSGVLEKNYKLMKFKGMFPLATFERLFLQPTKLLMFTVWAWFVSCALLLLIFSFFRKRINSYISRSSCKI